MSNFLLVVTIFLVSACNSNEQKQSVQSRKASIADTTATLQTPFDTTITTIHVFVALCDNQYQGIVPVPKAIGNGQDPDNNLYWGCGYGIRTYFKNSSQWMLVKKYPVDSLILERVVFKHKEKNAYLIADAYNGKYIQQCTINFFKSCAGQKKDTLTAANTTTGMYGNANLLAYIGHNGLMDFTLHEPFTTADNQQRDAVILACISRSYFAPLLYNTKANPLVWTSGLMCPEAYTLHDALESYLNNKPVDSIRNAAAMAYAKYQKCSLKAARNLLVTGW